MDERIPLVYVLSNGRSGSTLLELLIGGHERAWTVGELQVLPHDLVSDEAHCGCGARTAECAFWSSVLDSAPLESPSATLTQFRGSRNHGKVLRREHFRDLLAGRVSVERRAAAEAYGKLNHDLVAQVIESARERRGGEIDWVVDASKDPYRLLWLASSGRFDLRVVHLVKDPRAFVYSMIRSKERPTPSEVLRLSARWTVENATMHRLVSRALPPEHVRTIKYENLAGDPRGTLDDLGAWLGLEFTDDWHEGAFRESESHAVSGNQTRFKGGGVRLDERWRDAAPAWVQRTAWWSSAPTRASLGWS